MTQDQFIALLERCGSDPARWPEAERATALTLTKRDGDAAGLWQQYRKLDAMLDQAPVADSGVLLQRVLQQPLPQQPATSERNPLEQFINWLLPDNTGRAIRLWRPALAACLPLVCGLLLGSYTSFSAVQELNWEDELNLLSLTDYSEVEL